MRDPDTPWRKYGIALLLVTLIGAISEIPDLGLPSPQDPGWTPLIGLLQAVIAGVGFGLIVFIIATVWSRRSGTDDRGSKLRKGIYAFLVVGGGDFVVEFSTRISSHGHPTYGEFQHILAQMVEAGRGYLLPLILLVLFAGVMFLKIRRSH